MIGVFFIALFTDYTKERIVDWRDPEAYKLTGGWQTLQGLMAIGSGGLFGVGFGKSVMKGVAFIIVRFNTVIAFR